MSNAEARLAEELPSGRGPVGLPLSGSGLAGSGLAGSGLAGSGLVVGSVAVSRGLVAAGLVAGDIGAGLLAAASTTLLLSAVEADDLMDRFWQQITVILPVLVGAGWALGLYRSQSIGLFERFRLRLSVAVLLALAGTVIWARDGYPLELAAMPVAAMAALLFGAWLDQLVGPFLLQNGVWGVPTAILGHGASARALANLLLSQPVWGLRPVGFLELEPLGSGARPGPHAQVLLVPDRQALPRDPEALYRVGIPQVVLCDESAGAASANPRFHGHDNWSWIAGGTPGRSWFPAKRAVDFILALPLVLLTSPLVALLALAVKIADPGPAFYGQQRVGQNGRLFRVWKLRTMYRDAEQRLERLLEAEPSIREEWQRHFKLVHDPRVLPHIGSLLRRTSLDELPQLWNVLWGDMSLVGPRPFPEYHARQFDPEFQALRTSVPPGLTGLWQISARSTADLTVQRAHDCLYIRNRSLLLDLYLLVATVPAVIRGRGAC